MLTATGASQGTLTGGWSIAYNTNTSGRISVALSNAQPVNGPGQIVVLNFNVNGTQGSSTPLSFLDPSLNDGAVTVIGANGQVNVNSNVSISGNVSYYSNGKPVEGALLTLGGVGQTQTSDASGNFSFATVSAGSTYTLTPSKSDDTGGVVGNHIGALDASIVLQAVVGLITLTPQQTIAADVNNDGKVGTMDASYILQKVVGLINLPFPNQNAMWAFSPKTISYTNLNSNQAQQNFSAILIGDVNGEWSPSTATASTLERTSADLSQSFTTNGHSKLRMGAAIKTGQNVTIPVKVESIKGKLLSADMRFEYDASAYWLESIRCDAQGAMFAFNEAAPGKVNVAIASGRPLKAPGGLFTVTLRQAGRNEIAPKLKLTRSVLNNGAMRSE